MTAFFSAYTLAVILAAILDVAANMLLVRSEGFRHKIYGVVALALVGMAFTSLAYAVHGMDLAVAYAMWGGFGVLGTSVGGWLLFGQKLKPSAWAGIVLLGCGLAVLRMS